MGLDPTSTYLSKEAHDLYQTQQIRYAAIVCSGVSVATSIVAFYWFFRMQKLFRHRYVLLQRIQTSIWLIRERLIMLLIYGDVMRSAWYFIFAVYSIADGTVETRSGFCQASGFLVQYGTETSGAWKKFPG